MLRGGAGAAAGAGHRPEVPPGLGGDERRFGRGLGWVGWGVALGGLAGPVCVCVFFFFLCVCVCVCGWGVWGVVRGVWGCEGVWSGSPLFGLRLRASQRNWSIVSFWVVQRQSSSSFQLILHKEQLPPPFAVVVLF